ncbi:hypothetical protein ACFJIW_04970 [Tahibacter sp. UC22_41]|uniref:hypothetical protein n=1 Tax=Tahibacter sp. UC22_41 TaxID=3350178 RepID=UPI0036DDFE3C
MNAALRFLHRLARGGVWALAGSIALFGLGASAPAAAIDWHAAIVGDAGQSVDAPAACPGCCSGHGGISGRCASNGRVYCADGTVSPSCSCSSCGVTTTCSGGQYWNGSACVCPAGQSLVNGTCRTSTPTCSGGQVWNGSACACPAGQSLVNGTCRAPTPTCSGGQTWNGSACACPVGQSLVNGTCRTPAQVCSGGQYWNGSACVCPAGLVLVNGQCGAANPAFVIGPGISGNWFDPTQSGHGLQIDVIKAPTATATIFWFTFDNAGNPAWLLGVGSYSGNRLEARAVRTLNGRFPPNFVASQVNQLDWGTLTVTFDDCTHGRLDWAAADPNFTATGSMRLEQATQVAGTSCP